MKKSLLIMAAALAFGGFSGICRAAETPEIDIHGFISQGYLKTTHNYFFGDTESGSFEFDELGINFSKELTDTLRVGLQILARDFGSNGNNEMAVDWAFGDYHWKDWLGVRAGKIKTPKGLYNETRDVDMLRTSIFLPQSVYPEILRDLDLGLLGAGAYGHIDLNAGGMLSYQLMYGTQNVAPNEAASQALMGTTAVFTPVENDSIDVDRKYVLGLIWDTPLSGLRVGFTYDGSDIYASAHFLPGGMWEAGEKVFTDFKKFHNMVMSVEYTYGDLLLSGEYIQTDKKFDLIFPVGSDTEAMTADGWYLASSYQPSDWFALGAYYSESYNDMNDREGKQLNKANDIAHRAYFKDFCLTTNFIVNRYWTIKLEGHRFKGTNGVSPLDQVPDSNGNVFAEKDWNLFATKMTFSF